MCGYLAGVMESPIQHIIRLLHSNYSLQLLAIIVLDNVDIYHTGLNIWPSMLSL